MTLRRCFRIDRIKNAVLLPTRFKRSSKVEEMIFYHGMVAEARPLLWVAESHAVAFLRAWLGRMRKLCAS